MLRTQSLLGKLIAIHLVGLPAAAAAESCVILSRCDDQTECSPQSLSLQWTAEVSDMLTVNDVQMPVKRIIDGSVPSILVPGPDVREVMLIALDQPGQIVATSITIPRRYTEYENAVLERAVYAGPCEGLF